MAFWGRAFGETGALRYDHRMDEFSSNGPSYDYQMGGVQAGADLLRVRHDNGHRDVAGLYVGAMTGRADVNQVYAGGRAGKVTMNGYSLAAYWTHTGAAETYLGTVHWYLDGVLQGTRYASAEARSVLGQKIHPDGWGLVASLEGGYPLPVGRGWYLEPQAQILTQWNTINNDSDAFGRVKYEDSQTWAGRMGVRVTKAWQTTDNKQASIWAKADAWHMPDSPVKTTFISLDGSNPTGLTAQLGRTSWGQLGLGASGQVTRSFSVFTTGDYSFGIENRKTTSLGGKVGMRYEF